MFINTTVSDNNFYVKSGMSSIVCSVKVRNRGSIVYSRIKSGVFSTKILLNYRMNESDFYGVSL